MNRRPAAWWCLGAFHNPARPSSLPHFRCATSPYPARVRIRAVMPSYPIAYYPFAYICFLMKHSLLLVVMAIHTAQLRPHTRRIRGNSALWTAAKHPACMLWSGGWGSDPRPGQGSSVTAHTARWGAGLSRLSITCSIRPFPQGRRSK